MKTLTAIKEFLQKLVAQIYNRMPARLKIGVMVFLSTVSAGFLTLFVADLNQLSEALQNEYLRTLIFALIPLVTIVINILQEEAVKAGTKLLAAEGDRKTINILADKVKKTKEIISLS